MKLLVCGGRDYKDVEHFNKEMSNIFSLYQNQIDTIIEGGASGADNMAKNYALKNKINLVEVKADWQHFGKLQVLLEIKECYLCWIATIVFWLFGMEFQKEQRI